MTSQGLKVYPDPLIEAYLEYLKNGTDYTYALAKDRENARLRIREYIGRKVKEASQK